MRMSKGLWGQHFQLGLIICEAFFFQDMIKINQIISLKAWYVYFQNKKEFGTSKISTILENSSNIKNQRFAAKKRIDYCKKLKSLDYSNL